MLPISIIMFSCIIIVWLLAITYATDWHTCDDTPFCTKIRNKELSESVYYLKPNTLHFYGTGFKQDLINGNTGKLLSFTFTALNDNTFRIAVDDPDKVRHSAAEALNGELNLEVLQLFTVSSENASALVGETTVNVYFKPLKIEVVRNEDVVVSLNSKGYFTFNSYADDEAIALDVSFHGAERAYGIPEHAERLSLKTTGPGGLNPYRFYNVDYYAYNLETQEALYGAVPVLYGHGTNRTSGIFWLNSAQTFVDIKNGDNQVDAVVISESGVLDLFVFTGPTLADATKQYTKLTGTAPLPQMFALGYHQSRYSYMSQEDVETVVREFDNHDFPMDVIWLDIDYTDGYKYFTWNYTAFQDPRQMQKNIVATVFTPSTTMGFGFIIIALTALTYTTAWYTCSDKPFCNKIRNRDISESPFYLVQNTIYIFDTGFEQDVMNGQTGKRLKLKFTALNDNTFRILVEDPEKERHSAADALNGDLDVKSIHNIVLTDDVMTVDFGENTVAFQSNPLKIDVLRNGELVVTLNDKGRLTFNDEGDDEALALDILFHGAERAYGIPEHAERLSLKTTGPGGLNPYRLFNVDYYAYSLETQEALYGAVPVLYGHGTSRTSGVFWLNSAQTFVDINNGDHQVDALFISESGVLDLFVFTGPTLAAAAKQYTKLTGTAPLPQLFALGYHQSRYSYMSREDVETVIREFDNHDFPMDVIWLDIDYTDGYKYFTWNYVTFPEPIQMQKNIVATGRKLVGIIDPHYKVEVGYHVYDQIMEYGYYVKNPDGSVFQGMCWPGLSVYCDFFNPEAFEWYSNLYQLENFANSTLDMYIWNDMNEPSVFEIEEQTMPGNLLHYGDWIHRDLHNMYGYKQTQATHYGLSKRNPNTRPFILTRSHFAGSQRYTAMWTGDNVASWEHFRISIPMLLTQSLAGYSFCGADVGGFVNNVEDDLFQRWYQAGAWYPFFRGHSATDTDRREPYLYPEDIQQRIRAALRQRYVHLPVWYTLWFEHERYGEPIMRPLSYHFSSDPQTLDIDHQWLVGSNILVSPVLEKDVNQITIYIPGGWNELWYDISNNLLYLGSGNVNINVDMDSVPLFYRGGSIIFRKDTPRPSSEHMRDDSYTVYIFANVDGEATGNIYIDDYESFDYRQKNYLYERALYQNNELTFTKIDEDANYDATINISRIYLYSPPTDFTRSEKSIFKCNVIEKNTELSIDVEKAFRLSLS